MKITILGSGSAYGLPSIFNYWGKADPQNPQNNRTRASILLQDEGKSVLIDAGPDIRTQINSCKVSNVDSVLITHGHYDHIAGIPELPRAAKILNHPIKIFAAEGTMNTLRKSYDFLFEKEHKEEPESQKISWSVLPNFGRFVIENMEFETLLFPHHHIYSSAFRYQNFVYLTDWQDFPPQGAEDFLSHLKLLIIECNNGPDTDEVNGHANIEKIKEIQKRFAPEKIILTHISARADDLLLRQMLPENCVLAYDGMELFL